MPTVLNIAQLADCPEAKSSAGFEECGGKIYAVCGGTTGGIHSKTMYVYDPATDTWSQKTDAPYSCQSPVFRSVGGKLYLIGGYRSDITTYYDECTEYNPANDTWTPKTAMPVAMEDMGSAVYDGKIWIFGGIYGYSGGHLLNPWIYIYNPATDTWEAPRSWLQPRVLGDYCCTLGDKIYVVSATYNMSGYPSNLNASLSVQAYDPGTDTFATKASCLDGVCYKEVEELGGKLFVASGATVNISTPIAKIQVYNEPDDSWEYAYPDLPYAAVGLGMAKYGTSLYVNGGVTYPGTVTVPDMYRLTLVSDGITGLYPMTVRPEVPLVEKMSFLTRIHRHGDGTEQRLAMRKCPRTTLELTIADRRQLMESYLYARAMDEMAVPFWHEPAFLTQAVLAGDDHVHVATSAQSQFKVGNHALIIDSSSNYNVREISVLTGTKIDFTEEVSRNFSLKSQVIPLYRCWPDNIKAERKNDYEAYDFKLLVAPVDNDLGITPYAEGALLITDVNYLDRVQETFNRPFYRCDGNTGLVSQTVILEHADKGGKLGFVTHSRTELWSLRLMLYRLLGRAIAFNLATFGQDLVPNANLTLGSTTLEIEACGYTDFVQSRRGTIRVVLTDGTVLSRTVNSSINYSDTTERLTVDSAWLSTITPAQIDRIEYLDLVRLDTDDIVIRHQNAIGWASCEVPIVHVYPTVE